MHPVEFTWYKGLVLITSAMVIAFGILNIVYFNKIRLNDNCSEISESEANVALWLNLILVIFGAVLFFWSLFRLIFSGAPKKEVVNKTYNTHYHAPISPGASSTPSQFSPSTPSQFSPDMSSLSTPSSTYPMPPPTPIGGFQ